MDTTAPIRQRSGRNVNAWLDSELMSALQDYMQSLEVPPTLTRVLELTVREFLQKRGFWPPRGGRS